MKLIDDSKGKVIDEFKDIDVGPEIEDPAERADSYGRMANLHRDARRHALGVEKALDRLIEELDE